MSPGLTYELVRSRRKTLALHITADGRIIVRAPLRLHKSEIDRVVLCKEKWIRTHLAKINQKLTAKEDFLLDYGTSVILLGEAYVITAGKGNEVFALREDEQPEISKSSAVKGDELSGISKPFAVKGSELPGISKPSGETAGQHEQAISRRLMIPPCLSPEKIKEVLIRFYREAARQILGEKVKYYADKMRLFPSSIKITGAKTRWGSCSEKNSLCFSWRLIMAAEEVVDYVVVHELAHIREHNHSAGFWAIVVDQMPDYKSKRKALKLLQERLSGQNWD